MHHPRGQALVEFALAIPILTLVVLVLVEGAGVAFAMGALQHAAHEGGRYAALPGTASEAAVKTRVQERADPLDIDPTDITVAVNSGGRTFILRESGDRVRVQVTLDYKPLTVTILGGGATFGLSAASEFAVE